MDLISNKSNELKGEVKLPGDKSISHRAAIILPLCHGDAVVNNFLFAEDTVNTLNVMKMLNARIKIRENGIHINSNGINGLKKANKLLYVGNSGTSIRLLSGLLSALDGKFVLYGDNSLQKRPMKRIIKPLNLMGARIKSLYDNDLAPLIIDGGRLKGIEYNMEVPSAQVKSALLLAGLFAEGKTAVEEIQKTRDHTERMLKFLGADISIEDNIINIKSGNYLLAKDIDIPGDISSAAFIIAAAALTENSEIIIHDVLLNETRTGFIDIFKMMGGEIEIIQHGISNNEPTGSIIIKSSKLRGIKISDEFIPRLIDEIPLISVLAAFADGETIIHDAKELRYKESDRIKSIIHNLNIMGTHVEEFEDGMLIRGNTYTKKDEYNFESFDDHRIAMAFSLVGLILGNTKVIGCENVRTSFPEFVQILASLGAKIYSIY
ncbi:3-phosphoshikimate 1-carboxyvinyltransferase [Caloramator mitchellensis]|uniref:3-phosphoshikimate 1-carboxyvinyltransferase n=1 Tax=Caloramator mitchellensis TaxID=908809 RepID=A0A0R3JSV4_CALMK|nr:3-phosphoshikimate 1-carboxyvinyltransferase [Caloramator mitchellensis]KRQ86552.1 3-phosphoshikimate 1-carboxyvinyltransferase [Caloramator mitchellensis]